MKIITTTLCAGALMASAAVAGNLEEPIMESQVVAPSAEEELVTQDDQVFAETAQADGGWLVPALFLIFGAAVASN